MILCSSIGHALLAQVLGRFGMVVYWVEGDREIPGSHWGDSEAGLIANGLYVRGDTPLHSALHEACHYICMDESRREGLDTDAGGDYDEENAVCYLQILLSDYFPGVGLVSAFSDMDAWGYTFRLGSAKRWFYEDADDARQWLIQYALIDASNVPMWRVR